MGKKRDADDDAVESPGFVEEYVVKPGFDEDGVQSSSGIGKDGREYPDPVPMAPPVGYENPPDLMEMMRTMIRNEAYQARLDQEGFDTEEEAADFDIDDDPLPPLTLHEALLATPPSVDRPQGAPGAAPPPPADPHGSAAKEGGQGAASPEPAAPAPPSAAPSSTST